MVGRLSQIINPGTPEAKYIVAFKDYGKYVVGLHKDLAPTHVDEGMTVGCEDPGYYQTKIESIGQDRDKNDINHRIEFINSFFPNLWCVFERIVVERIFYFFIYNASCAIAEVFRNDQNE